MTKKEIVELQRQAFIEGAIAAARNYTDSVRVVADSVRRFPMPKVTRLREYAAEKNLISYRVNNGNVEYKPQSTDGWRVSLWTLKDFAAFGSLAANPTEEVDDE